MAKFLSRAQLYRILQRELPDGVYPDGAPSAFFSTADMDSVADVAATAYGNLERIYDNDFPQYADESIDKWISKAFVGRSFPPGFTLQQKRDKVVAKLRKQAQLAEWELLVLVASYLPAGKFVQIVPNGSRRGGWLLGESRLGVDTLLGYDLGWEALGIPMDQWCERVHASGFTLPEDFNGDTSVYTAQQQLLLNPQVQAYGYEIRIFDYTVTGDDLSKMLEDIKNTEPARSTRMLRQNLNLADFGLVNPVTDVDQFSLVDCITQDPSSSTGYSGMEA